ncbi:MAG TPA: hypothetical protein VGC28_01220 [Sphingomonas sp.]
MFELQTDFAKAIVRMKLTGFWTIDTVKAFMVAEQDAASKVVQACGRHSVLADLMDFKIQAQESVALLQGLIGDSRYKAVRLAIVAGEGLARIQIKRIMIRPGMRVFDSVEAAEHWLVDDTAEDGRAAPVPQG